MEVAMNAAYDDVRKLLAEGALEDVRRGVALLAGLGLPPEARREALRPLTRWLIGPTRHDLSGLDLRDVDLRGLGLGARLMMSALQVAGATVGLASGLGFAQQVDPIASQPAAIFSGFFSLMGLLLIMSAGLHRVMLEAAADSYQIFPPGAFPPIGDASSFMIDAVSNSFRLGIQIAAPVLIFSLIFNIALGMVSRLIPQVQVFMTAMPLSIILSLAVIALGLGGGLMIWLEAMETQMRVFTVR
jgi:flagellar biosynthesis protein FliR